MLFLVASILLLNVWCHALEYAMSDGTLESPVPEWTHGEVQKHEGLDPAGSGPLSIWPPRMNLAS